MVPVELLLPFFASEDNVLCILHDHNIADVEVRSKLHLVLALHDTTEEASTNQ